MSGGKRRRATPHSREETEDPPGAGSDWSPERERMASSRLFAGVVEPALLPSTGSRAALLRTTLLVGGGGAFLPASLLSSSTASARPASSAARQSRLPDALHVPSAASPDAAAAAAAASSAPSEQPRPFSVLFVCLGNICRSPAAEGVFRSLVRKKGLDPHFNIDSAGTIGYHQGDPADPRMRAASKRRGIEITSISRPIRPSDFKDFDLILAMDLQNRDDILAKYEQWGFKEPLPADAHKKVKLICSYCTRHAEKEVPDPYYGGPQGFEKVLDLLEDACDSLLDSILLGEASSP